MADIDVEIAAYEAIRDQLEAEHTGQWILIHDRQQIGLYDTFEAAAEEATKSFGSGPYLIRQIGAPPAPLPASVMYYPAHGKNNMRL